MILRGIKKTLPFAVLAVVAACTAPVPGGITGPFGPGNTLTFFYQGVLTDPPEQAVTFDCGNQLIAKTCVQLSNGAQFDLTPTETGVVYGNGELQMILQLDAGGLPSGVGQLTDSTTGVVTGLRWVSLPS